MSLGKSSCLRLMDSYRDRTARMSRRVPTRSCLPWKRERQGSNGATTGIAAQPDSEY